MLKILFTVILSVFCIISKADNSDKIPAEVQEKIPENIDYIGFVDGTTFSFRMMKKPILAEVQQYSYFQEVDFSVLLNRYYIFGSTVQDYYGVIVFSRNGNAKRFFQMLNIQLRKKDAGAVITENFATSTKEKLFFKLYTNNLLLISKNEMQPKKYKCSKPSRLLKELTYSYIFEVYSKFDPKKIPIFYDYISGVPTLSGFKESRMMFSLSSLNLEISYKYSSNKDAEQKFRKLESSLKKIAVKYPKFPSTFSRKLRNDTIHFSLSKPFFPAARRIVHDPDYQPFLTIK